MKTLYIDVITREGCETVPVKITETSTRKEVEAAALKQVKYSAPIAVDWGGNEESDQWYYSHK